jgi:hypothetical protein
MATPSEFERKLMLEYGISIRPLRKLSTKRFIACSENARRTLAADMQRRKPRK